MNTDNEIRFLAGQDYTASAIASNIGMNVEYVRQRLRAMGIQAGRINTIQGLTDHSYKLRAKLGFILTDLIENNLQPVVSAMTGLNRNEIAKARMHPYEYDWKLSQIERTLGCVNGNIKEIL